jgi:hypothetical protein
MTTRGFQISSAPNIAHAAYQADGRPGIEARTREVREAMRQSAALVVERAQQESESQR